MSAKQSKTTVLKTLTTKIVLYISNNRPKVKQFDKKFRASMNDPLISDYDKARKLLIGSHQWYLPCFHKEMTEDLLKDIEKMKPWTNPYNHCKSFEDLYAEVEKWLKRKFINQLTIYDVALRIAITIDKPVLMPRDYVYVHAIPLTEYKKLVKARFQFPKLTHDGKVPYSQLASHFGGLDAREIEDLLCHMGKGFVGKCMTGKTSCP